METKTKLPTTFCLLIEIPQNLTDCSPWTFNESLNSSERHCFRCARPGRFLLDGRIDQPISLGYYFFNLIGILTVLVGILGTIGNWLIITVLRKRGDRGSFDLLLMILATCDLLCSSMATLTSIALMAFINGTDRSLFNLIVHYVAFSLTFLGRSGSTFMTILITLERYLVIKFPIKSSIWFTRRNAKIMASLVLTFAFLLNLSRLSNFKFVPNDKGKDVPSLKGLDYIVQATKMGDFFYVTLKSLHSKIDMWTPLPILLSLNLLIFIEIHKFMKKRQGLTSKQKGDIRAAQMFFPVVIVLFICNIVPICNYIMLLIKRIYYRELAMGFLFSITMNAAVNLPIYYAKGASFRQEIKSVLPSWLWRYLEDDKDSGKPKDSSTLGDQVVTIETKSPPMSSDGGSGTNV